MKDKLIRDRLIVSIKNVRLSERLQTDETLTLDKAKKLARQKEAVREQQSILKREETTLHYIKSKGKVPRTHRKNILRTQEMHTMWQIPPHSVELPNKGF